MASTTATNPDTLVTLKVNIEGCNRRFKLPLRDLGASTLPDRLRFLLAIPPSSEAIFERYSDSAASFVVLDPSNASVYKQLYRAAKAKLKLRLKVTVKDKEPVIPKPATVEDEEPSQAEGAEERPTYITPSPAVVPQAPQPPIATTPDQSGFPSVAEIQRGFEDLMINNYRCTSATAAASACCRTPMRETNSMSTETVTKIPKMCPYATSSSEIHVTRGASARDKWFAELAAMSNERPNIMRGPPLPASSIFSVYCNNCNDAIPDAHYHCSTCDDGDYDLCQTCVEDGVVCEGNDHWMIKRLVKNGKVINSTTETLAPKAKPSFSGSKTTLVTPEPVVAAVEATRTCNSCIQELPENNFVTCLDCEDFDLCIPCHVGMEHGHHPKHAFASAVEGTNLGSIATALLSPGRNVGHNAVCDGCDKYIYGVRHKCLDCPDWDFCATCILDANYIHPRHRFVPIYEPLNDIVALSRSFSSKSRHHGIYCDGPLCNTDGHHSYIKGDRYKCAVCDDTDFCASCEASPANPHNKTHPLIKFKTPVRNVSVTTLGDHENGQPLPVMGDRRGRTTSKATETTPTQSTNAAAQVQTVAELQPTNEKTEAKETEVKLETKSEKVEVKVQTKPELVAHFVRDAVADGTVLPPNHVFEQTWYLRNGGKDAWPAGCSVKFVGGDNMCAVDPEHPASVHELVSAAESTTCYTEVTPGQEVGFTVLMRTPSRSGNFISYWRLIGPDGNKFGHRLWCDVNVKEPVKKEEPKEVEPKTEGSQMIFPKLEKESPTASVHQGVAPVAESENDDDFEDFVDEELDEASEEDDGFATDEEYDILDASDEEYLAEQSQASRK